MRLTYDEYKEMECQVKAFDELESTHVTMGDPAFYHRSFRLKFAARCGHEGLTIEFHGPSVRSN